ncbi:NAD(+)/NADH kinase [Chloroflexota bacterium]
MKKVGILYHPKVDATLIKAGELEKYLSSRGVSVWLCSAWDRDKARAQLDNTNLILTVGGDGTILHAAQIVIPGTTPIAGINLGKLGFMTELDADEAPGKITALLGKDGWVDERAMLQVELATPGRSPRLFHALNDIVLARGEIARVIRVEANIDGQYMTTYKADGVIIATATGSTGYALAAGGPIIYPQSEDFLMIPIAPHLSSAYAVILPKTAEVRLSVTAFHPATISIDGHINLPLSGDDTVTIKKSPSTTRFWRIRSKAYFFSSLEERLKGKAR